MAEVVTNKQFDDFLIFDQIVECSNFQLQAYHQLPHMPNPMYENGNKKSNEDLVFELEEYLT